MDAHPHAEPASPEVALLPATQVAAIMETIRAEQARLLREQQAVIVAQVMRTLKEKGIAPEASDFEGIHQQQSEHITQSKIDKSLHSLVLHSLQESGLDYPHVQRAALSSEQTMRSPYPSPNNSTHHRSGKTTVVSRYDTSQPQVDPLIEAGASEPVAHDSFLKPTTRSVKKKATSTLITKSPLQDALPGRDARRNKPRSHWGQRRDSPDQGEIDGEHSELESARKKIGRKTLAILDRSRALLDDMKKHHRVSPRGGASSPFVSRLRQTLAAPHAQEPASEDHDDGVDTAQASRPASPALCVGHEREVLSEDTQNDPSRTLSDPAVTHASALPSDSGDPSVFCTDIEILKPPAHTPENENEWENELARQILTIYATSVKAKRATNRPSSHSSNRAGSSGSYDKNPRLTASVSLPALSQPQGAPTTSSRQKFGARSRSPPRAAVQYSWEPSQRLQDGRVVVNMPKVPRPIWFAGTGAVKSVWCAIAEEFHALRASPVRTKAGRGAAGKDAAAVCEHQLCEEVRRLEAKQQYAQCVTTLETLLVSLVRARGVEALDTKLWKQLVVTCNAFASRCVDYKKFPAALQLIKQAEHLLHNSILVDDAMRFELLAYLYDTYAHYYYRRGKSHAGLQYMLKAHEIHGRQSNWAHLAKCRLHIANLLSLQGKHQDAMGYMTSILEMIEDRKLEDQAQAPDSENGASAQKVCLAAVCYNNLAIEQLHLRAFEAASVSSGNAKRLARLCLSYSNRWLAQFDATSNCVDLAIATLMEDANAAANAPYKS